MKVLAPHNYLFLVFSQYNIDAQKQAIVSVRTFKVYFILFWPANL